MEFPDLGEHCALKECRRLDFLPIKCTSCKQDFCSLHFRFEAHHCPVASEEEQNAALGQDPVCPLCNRPVPVKAGESADYKVSQHIDQNCAIEQREREKVFKNRCSLAGCKRRELMPLTCESCRLNHCLSHRHPSDHQCKGSPSATLGNANSKALAQHNQPHSTGIAKSLSNLGQRSASAYETIRSSVANTFSNNGGNSGGGSSSFFQPRRPAPSAAAMAAAAAASARAAESTRSASLNVSSPQGGNGGNFNSLQGNLTEEEALSIAIQESLEVSGLVQPARATATTAGNASTDQKCQVS